MKYEIELSALDKAELFEALNVWLREKIKVTHKQHMDAPAATSNFISNKIKFINRIKDQLDDRRTEKKD